MVHVSALGSRSRCNTHRKGGVAMRLPKRQERARFWELVRSGLDRVEAARRAGVPDTSARHWFRQAGGVLPPTVTEKSRSRYLSIREREEVFAGIERGESIRRIAQLLGRACLLYTSPSP